MTTVLLIIHLFVTLALIGVVLIQRSEGGGLGVGTSQGMGSFMSGRGTANLLTRTTAILGTAFLVLSLALALLNRGTTVTGRSSILDLPPTPAIPAPVAPSGASGATPASRPDAAVPPVAPPAPPTPVPAAPAPTPAQDSAPPSPATAPAATAPAATSPAVTPPAVTPPAVTPPAPTAPSDTTTPAAPDKTP
jgi:preprotein translocase subunit SecG